MQTSLIQIKVDPTLKDKLKRIALAKGLNITSYIKMTLIHEMEEEEAFELSENGFTFQEEQRLLKSIQKGEKAYRERKLKAYTSMEEALESLDE